MRIWRRWWLLGLMVGGLGLTGCNNSSQVSPQTKAPAQAAPQASNPTVPVAAPKVDEAANKTRIDMQVYQINHSNLPDAEKQRLIAQVRASSPK